MCVCVCVCVCVSSITMARTLGIDCDIADIIREYRLRWLGHVGRMNDDRMPKRVLFGELPATRPRHGPRKRWRDIIVDDLRSISPLVPSDCWFDAAQDRSAWRQIAHRRPPARASSDPDSGFRCACGKVCRLPGISSATRRTAKLADSPFAIIAIGNGHVQGSRCACVCVCVCVCPSVELHHAQVCALRSV